MKKILLLSMVLVIGIVSISFHLRNNKVNEQILTNRTVTQVAIIVRDIDKAREAWAKVLGVQTPGASVAESHPSRPTRYKGTSSDAKAKLAFFDMGNLQIELIQPLGGKSTWQEFLDKRGEGIHHIAFSVKNIEGVEKQFELQGMPTVQNGGWDGGAYSYIDASRNLGCILELLEDFK
jgi:methylmalonyl-CoA/ethylmalonyl-CoA epimerase